MLDRRQTLIRLMAAAPLTLSSQESAAQWYKIIGEDGQPVANLRLPVELTAQIDELPGIIRVGSTRPDLSLAEFTDFNCPHCKRASRDVHALVTQDRNLRVTLVNNPILSPMSAQAAKVALAVFALKGAATAYELRMKLFAQRGTVDGLKALELAEGLGAKRSEVEQMADGPKVGQALTAQMKLAAALGFVATPSFMIAGVGLLGHPGRKPLRKILDSVRACDQVVCG
ncbi:MAG: DsbA family protein [Beijerinckiaceae bacterium]|nr:DsbA family protein [Beijerinckiaceae bacterium]MBX9757959.1 DsbA family protein [Beijerinckiaceae bacterium]MDO9442162.1 DsbA family protein [Beijerinckiaceae bacterium]